MIIYTHFFISTWTFWHEPSLSTFCAYFLRPKPSCAMCLIFLKLKPSCAYSAKWVTLKKAFFKYTPGNFLEEKYPPPPMADFSSTPHTWYVPHFHIQRHKGLQKFRDTIGCKNAIFSTKFRFTGQTRWTKMLKTYENLKYRRIMKRGSYVLIPSLRHLFRGKGVGLHWELLFPVFKYIICTQCNKNCSLKCHVGHK